MLTNALFQMFTSRATPACPVSPFPVGFGPPEEGEPHREGLVKYSRNLTFFLELFYSVSDACMHGGTPLPPLRAGSPRHEHCMGSRDPAVGPCPCMGEGGHSVRDDPKRIISHKYNIMSEGRGV